MFLHMEILIISHFLHLLEILPDGDTANFVDPCVVAVFLASLTRATRRHTEALEGTLFSCSSTGWTATRKFIQATRILEYT